MPEPPTPVAREAELRARLEKNPSDTLTRFVLAKDYLDAGAHERAVEQFRLLVAGKADWMKAWILLGQALAALGRREQAREALETALRLAVAQRHQGPEAEVRALLEEL